MAEIKRRNRVMGYVLQACNELDIEPLEVYCDVMKCVYRFVDESEREAHWFLYGSGIDYPTVLDTIRETVEGLKKP